MQTKSNRVSQSESDICAIPSSAMYTEPWWRNVGYTPVSMLPRVSQTQTSVSSQEGLNGGSESNDGIPVSSLGSNMKDDDVAKESGTAVTPQSDRNSHQEHQDPQQASPNLPGSTDNYLPLALPSQLEHSGHSIAYASNPFPDMPAHPYPGPYYSGVITNYGPQPLVHPQFLGARVPLPLPVDLAQEPVYVNAKQYHGILRRRESRAKAELEKKLIKTRKPYLHESRHQHALRRERATGGRFAKKVNEGDSSNHSADRKCAHSGHSSQTKSVSSSGSDTLPCDSADYWPSSGTQQDQRTHNSGDLQASTYTHLAVNKEGETHRLYGN